MEGVIVEAGCYKGGSTAKFSLAAAIANRKLFVIDSFQGIPKNTEPHDKDIFGGGAKFPEGRYCGTLDEVKANVQRFGRIESCTFVEGWFEDTLPTFKEKVAAVYIDVDLASSTRTCLKHFYPLLERGGVCFSQDGHLPLVIEVFENDDFLLNEVGCEKPHTSDLGEKKLISIKKE
jgi:O-methyltransferase